MENKSFLEKALVKAEKTLDATPEYKKFEKALKAKREAWDAVCATDEAYEKAKKATDEAFFGVDLATEPRGADNQEN